MNCRHSSTPNPRRTWAWLKAGLFGAALALFGTAQAQVTVTATAGDLGPTNYATVSAAFAAINAGTPQGAITVTVTTSITEPAAATALLASGGSSSYTSVLLTCTGDVTINSAATPTGSRGIIELLGADNVTIDGDDPGTGGTRNLTIQMATTTTTGTQCIRLASNSTTGLDGANNNTVKNCNIIGGRSSGTSTTSSWGILMSNGASGTGGAYSSLNTLIENNAITRCYTGIGAIGVSATYPNTGTIIRNNVIGSATDANGVGQRGITLSYSAVSSGGATISGNDIRVGVSTTGFASTIAGIEIGTVNYGFTIERNNIHDIVQPSASGYGAHGIYISGSTNVTLSSIRNNFIRDCKMVVYQTSFTSTFVPTGVFIAAGATGISFDHNTLVMGTQLGSGVNFSSSCVNAGASGVVFTSFRNNILVNTHNSTNAYGFYTTATGNISGGSVDNNDYYVTGSANVGYYNAAARTTLGAWQTATGKDGAAVNVNPPFVSGTDLHIQTTPAAPALVVYQNGATGTGVSNDIDNDTRAATPCIGADEFALPVCSTADAGTVSGSGSACTAANNILSLSGATSGLGVTFQWAYGTVGGPYSTLLGTDATQNTSGIPVGSWEVVCTLTCANCGPCDDITAPFALTINALPSVSVDVPSANYCIGSAAIAITASGASTYAWSPGTGLSATTGATVNANPTATTTYTVTGTDANGCTNTATSAITIIGTSPTAPVVTANPNPTCFNGSSQLNAVSSSNSGAYSVSSIAYGLTSGSGSALTFTNTGADDGSATVALPFAFTYNGIPYSTIYVHTNGFVSFSSGQPGGSPYTETIPTATTPNNYIAICHDDLNVTGGGVVSTFTSGSTPNRVFVVDYLNVKFYNGASNNGNMSGQIKLFEADGHIEIHVTSSDDPTASAHTIGIENAAGTAGTAAPGRNNVTYSFTSATPEAWKFEQASSTFSWTPNTFLSADNIANPLATGVNVASQTYTVTASNGTCTSFGTVTLTTTPPITSASITGNLSYCAGGSTTLTAVPADGAGPYTYLWSPGGETTAAISVNAVGSYSAQVTDNCGGSVNTGSVSVTENALPTVGVTPTTGDYCATGPVVSLTGSGASTYSWAPAAGLSATTGTSVDASPSSTTTYTVTGTDANGCVNTATTTITSGTYAAISSTTATPSTVCAGEPSQLQVNLASSAYCTTVQFTTNDEAISNVTFADINNSSACAAGAGAGGDLENFTAVVGNVVAGSTYPMTVSGTTDGSFTNFFTAFFDWDQDGVFESQQAIGSIANTACVLTATNNVTVPATARNGNTRMRIVKNYNSSPTNPCGTYSYGQAEDYTLNVTGGVSLSYSWAPAGDLNNATIANPIATIPTENTSVTYTVTVTNGACASTGTATVTTPLVNDGDPCTLDACVGGVVSNTFQDADSDGLCDANDPCPNLANLVNGDPCDDGDACTIGDVVAGCVCAGTFQDSDVDGVCDANDPCPFLANVVPGDPCNDGNVCTINDVFTALCVCAGTFQDTDLDGTCDANDPCPTVANVAPGDPCDDGDACTINDAYTLACVCAGTFEDTDSDGICNANDNCPTVPGVQGGTCDDGNPNTTGDVLDANCVCAGALVDCEGTPGGPELPGTGCDDSNVCTINDTWSVACVCVGTFQDTDGDGTCDANDNCPTVFGQIGSACSDGDPCTTGDVLDASCVCVGTFTDTDLDGLCDANDNCPTVPGVQGDPCTDGDACTINDVLNASCVCAGTFQDTDSDGVCDANDNCPTVVGQQGSACSDGDPCTINDVLDVTCVCVGTPAPVTAGITASSTVYCTPGSGVTLTGTGGDTYSWAPAAGLSSTTGSPVTATPASTTTYTVTATNLAGCSDTETVTITTGTTPATPTASASPSTICPNGSSQLQVTGANPALVVTISGTGFLDEVSYTLTNANNVVVSSGGPFGTGSTNPFTVANPGPSPYVLFVETQGSFNDNVANYLVTCGGNTILSGTVTGGGTFTSSPVACAASYTYSWSPATFLSSTTIANPVASGVTTTTTYTATIFNDAGCSASTTTTVTVDPGAVPVIQSVTATPNPVCPGGSTLLNAQMPGSTLVVTISGTGFLDEVSFTLTNANSVVIASGGPFGTGSTNPFTVTNPGPGPYSLFVETQGSFNDNVANYSVTCNGNPTLSGTVTGGTNTTQSAPNCGDTYTFSWSPATYLSSTTVSNPTASGVVTAETYTVTVTNTAGCTAQGSVSVTLETLDTDGDGTVDCADGCPADPLKIAPGQCGCGVADTDTDGDLTADCNDLCPADPLKIAPGICGCGVSDVDTDGDLTADCNDLCPLDPNKIVPGICGCGVADTDGDGDGIADCNDLCPAVFGTVGSPCNDGNAGTINDALDATCTCVGTIPTCTFNTVLLDLVTDNDGSQTSWDVVNIGTTTVVCSGSGYLPNQTITLDCCLPNGCYELRVFDSMGDGMANGTIGGYVLRATGSGNKRIIDNSGDGIFTNTSQIANNLGFCVPIGNDVVIAAHCDKVNWLPNDIIQATANPAVTGQFGVSNANSGYQFWFFNPDGGYSRRILQTHAAPGPVTGPPANVRSSYLRLNTLVTQPIPYYTNLNVRVRTQVAGVFSEFGPACRFRLDPPCSTTQLTTVADPVVSCGATGLTLSSTIYATAVPGASTYQFEFTKSGYLRRISSSSRQVALSFVTNPLQNNTCYSVRLRVSFDGGTTFCPFGPSCNVTIGTASCFSGMTLEAGDGIGNADAQLTVWPNPNDGTLVNVSLTEFDATVNTVMVDVTDVYGKLVSTRTVPVQDGYLNTTMAFEQDLAPGLYLVNLQVGEKRYTERLVIQ